MGRRSIMLLLTLAVLLQPALASVCIASCSMSPMPAQRAHAMTMNAGGTHLHHHASMADHPSSYFASSACDKKVDVRSAALLLPTVAQVFAASDSRALEAPSESTSLSLRLVISGIRFNPPIVVPLRI